MLYLISLFIGIQFSCRNQGQGFALPEGDAANGKVIFTELGCNNCHSIGSINWTGSSRDLHITLGGEVTSIKTYGELVTSIINPSHKVDAKHRLAGGGTRDSSKMIIYNDFMTVQELVDLVTFLKDQYRIKPPDTHYYPYAYY